MLEFLRRSAGDAQPAAEEPLAATPRVVIVRRSPLVLGAAGTGWRLILAFLLGLSVGGAGGGDGTAVIKAAEFRNDQDGLRIANSVRTQLEQLNL